jgi:hypothetical protein
MKFTPAERASVEDHLQSVGWRPGSGRIASPSGGLWLDDSHFCLWAPAEMLGVFRTRGARTRSQGDVRRSLEHDQVCQAIVSVLADADAPRPREGLILVVAAAEEPSEGEIISQIPINSRSDVESALQAIDELWYGTYLVLRGAAPATFAIAVGEPFVRPDQQGRFMLYSEGTLERDDATRSDLVQWMGKMIGGTR